MAVTPLFVADLDTLRGALRLSGVPADTDAEAIIREAVMQARMEFVRRLTQARVEVLQGYSFTENPSTANENLRMIANLTESMLVRLHLMRTLPVLYMDTADKDQQAWNEEGLFRQKSAIDLSVEKKTLRTDIDQNMQLLAGEETPGSESNLKIKTFEPETTPPRPGDSVWGSS